MLAAAGTIALALGTGALTHLGGVPYNIHELFGKGGGVASLAAFALVLLLTGFAPACVAMVALRRPRHALAAPAWAALAAVVAWALLRAAVTTESLHDILGAPVLKWGWDWELLGRFLALYGGVVLILIVAGAIAGARRGAGDRSRTEVAVGLALWSVPWLILARLVVINWASTDTLTELIRSEPYPGDALLAALVMLIGLNAAGLAHVLRQPTSLRVLSGLCVTIALVIPGWFLLDLGPVPALTKYGVAFPAARFLLGPDRRAALSGGDLFLRWSGVQVSAVLLLAYGQWIALLLFPAAQRAPARGGRRRHARVLAAPPTPTAAAATAPATAPAGRTCLVLAAAYTAFVIYGSLVPFDYHPRPWDEAVEHFRNAPYLSILIGGRADLVANLLLFIPLTFFVMGALGRGRAACWPAALVVVPAAGALSAAIEFTQVYFPPRTVSLNDMVAETAGGAIGTALWIAGGVRLTRWVRDLWQERVRHALVVKALLAYAAVMLVYQLLPFDLTIRPVEIYRKLYSTKVTLIPFTDSVGLDLYMMGVKVAIMLPVGYLLALVVRPGSGFRAALGWGALAAAGIEAMQLFVYSRYTSTTDVILGTAGAAAGGWLAARVGPAARAPLVETPFWRRYGRWLRLGAAGAWLAVLVAYKWEPLHFVWPARGLAAQMRASFQVPLYYQYWNSELGATTQLVRDLGGPLILGMLLASLTAGGRRGRAVAAVLAAVVAVVGEAGQWFFPPHTADVTTMVLAAGAGVAGVLLYEPFVRVFIRTPAPEDEARGGVLST